METTLDYKIQLKFTRLVYYRPMQKERGDEYTSSMLQQKSLSRPYGEDNLLEDSLIETKPEKPTLVDKRYQLIPMTASPLTFGNDPFELRMPSLTRIDYASVQAQKDRPLQVKPHTFAFQTLTWYTTS